jgi:hypothetical protein
MQMGRSPDNIRRYFAWQIARHGKTISCFILSVCLYFGKHGGKRHPTDLAVSIFNSLFLMQDICVEQGQATVKV